MNLKKCIKKSKERRIRKYVPIVTPKRTIRVLQVKEKQKNRKNTYITMNFRMIYFLFQYMY